MTDAKLNNSDEEVRLEDLQPIYRRLAKVFGLNNALLFGREFGGQSLYFPKVDAAIAVKARQRMVFQEWENGLTYGELARKYDLTEMWIRQIVNRYRKAK